MAPECSIAKRETQATLNELSISVAFVKAGESEGEAIKRLLDGRNQAAFVRQHKIPGGTSMVSQHISGNRPIALEAAIAYAKAFGVPISDFSARLDQLIRQAAAHLSPGAPPGSSSDPPTPLARTKWPFSEELLRAVAALPERQLTKFENSLRVQVELPVLPKRTGKRRTA